MEKTVTLACLLLVFSISSVLGTLKCYGCAGTKCNDPFNKDASTVLTCSSSMNSRMVPSITNGNRFKRDTADDYVCIKYNSLASSQNQTVRSCFPRQTNGIDACKTIKATIGLSQQVWSCSVCNSDLCNSASYISLTHLSILFVLQSIALLILVH